MRKKYEYHFQQCQPIRCFDDSIYPREITIVETGKHQSNLLNNIVIIIPEQDQNKVGTKKEIFMKIRMLSMKIQNHFLILSKEEYLH